MTAFAQLSIFVSIVLGVAVAHLLGGVSLLVDQRLRALSGAVRPASDPD